MGWHSQLSFDASTGEGVGAVMGVRQLQIELGSHHAAALDLFRLVFGGIALAHSYTLLPQSFPAVVIIRMFLLLFSSDAQSCGRKANSHSKDRIEEL